MGLRALARRLYRFPGPTLNTASDANLGRFARLLLEALSPGESPAVLNVGGGKVTIASRIMQTARWCGSRRCTAGSTRL